MADVTFVGEDSRAIPQKYRDMGNGTFARIIYSKVDPGGSSKTIVGHDYRTLPRKLKDMSDGTWAPIITGSSF